MEREIRLHIYIHSHTIIYIFIFLRIFQTYWVAIYLPIYLSSSLTLFRSLSLSLSLCPYIYIYREVILERVNKMNVYFGSLMYIKEVYNQNAPKLVSLFLGYFCLFLGLSFSFHLFKTPYICHTFPPFLYLSTTLIIFSLFLSVLIWGCIPPHITTTCLFPQFRRTQRPLPAFTPASCSHLFTQSLVGEEQTLNFSLFEVSFAPNTFTSKLRCSLEEVYVPCRGLRPFPNKKMCSLTFTLNCSQKEVPVKY